VSHVTLGHRIPNSVQYPTAKLSGGEWRVYLITVVVANHHRHVLLAQATGHWNLRLPELRPLKQQPNLAQRMIRQHYRFQLLDAENRP
jgi:hypothetical protein